MSLKKNIRNGLILSALVYGGAYMLFLAKVWVDKAALEQEFLEAHAHADKAKRVLETYVSKEPSRKELKDRNEVPKDAFRSETRSIAILFFRKELNRSIPVPDYWAALLEKIQIEESNARVRQQIKQRLGTKVNSGDHVGSLIEALNPDLFAYSASASSICGRFHPGTVKLTINEEALEEAPAFAMEAERQWAIIEKDNFLENVIYDQAMSKASSGLPKSAFQSLKSESDRAGILKKGTREFTFRSQVLGEVVYQLPSVEFDEAAFNEILSRAYRNMYANNSLSTGNKPWAYCYGSYNECGGYGCSEIQVKSGGTDVVVTIKDGRGEVVRHAYIRKHSSYVFRLPNGTYQPFFYYGKGWNPNKEMKYVGCGMLKGGFTSGEHVGKDDMQYLSNNILTYTLVETTFGNFNTRPSNTNEAL